MKIRETKLYYLDLKKRYNSKYKKLFQIRYNIHNTLKIIKFNKHKWKSLKAQKYNLFKNRIYTNPNFQFTLNPLNVTNLNISSKRYKYKNLLHNKRIIQYYYGIKKIKSLKKIYIQKFEPKIRFQIFYLKKILSVFHFFEKRLDVILCRVFFLPSIYFSQKFIKQKNITLNNILIHSYNTILQLNDIVEIVNNREIMASEIYYIIRKNFYKPRFLSYLNYFHLEINYNILTFRMHTQIINLKQLHSFFPFKANFSSFQQYLLKKA